MRTIPCSPSVALAALFLSGVPDTLSAETVIIAESSQVFPEFGAAGIDDSGTVVFIAERIDSLTGTRTRGVYKGNGGPLNTIAETVVGAAPGTGPGVQWVEIRDSVSIANGKVVFVAIARHDPSLPFHQSFVLGLFSEAGPATPLHTASTASITDGFRHSQVEGFINRNSGYAVGSAGPHPIRRTFIASPIAKTGIEGVYPLEFNDRNQILYVETNTATNTGALKRTTFHVIGSENNQQFDPSLTETETLATDFGASFGIAPFPAVEMNNSGDVTYLVVEEDGVQRLKKNQTTIVEWNRNSQEFQPFTNLGAVAINDSGAVFFEAWGRPNILAQIVPGIYRGADPAMDLVVARGGRVSDSPIQAILRFHGVNNSGQVLVTAILEDGRTILFRTTEVASPPPPPPPSTVIRWVGPPVPPPVPPPTGESFGVSLHWEPKQVPEKSETRSDIAVFDLPAVYTVEVGTQTSERLLVREGQVTFSLNAPHEYRVGALSFDQPSVVVNNAHLRLTGVGGALRSIHALIGESAASRVDVEGAGWATTGSMRVGGAGEGILRVGHSGIVISGEARIGTGAGGGNASVTSGQWLTGNIAIGMGGRGELTIEAGGLVESAIASIGEAGSAENVVLVTGAQSTSVRSTWTITEQLRIGFRAAGQLNVVGGGLVTLAGSLEVGSDFTDESAAAGGFADVGGVHEATGARSQIEVTGKLVVGGTQGEGILRIREGAVCKVTGETFVGTAAAGDVIIRGAVPGNRSTFETTETLWIGFKDGNGTVTVEDGGNLFVGTARLASLDIESNAPATGQLHVSGVDAATKRGTKFHATQELFVGNGGTDALMSVVDGGEAVVGQNCVIGSLSKGSLELRGVHSQSGSRSGMLIVGQLMVGFGEAGPGTIFIDDGALLSVGGDATIGDEGVARVFVRGSSAGMRAELEVDGNITVGGNADGRVTLDGGTVTAGGNLIVNAKGAVTGIGTLAVPVERRVRNGGTISKGLSPGIITIEGNYEQTAEGQIIVEIGGTDPSRYDQLVVTGSTELNGRVVLRFIDGFAPRAGQEFAFLRTAQPATGAFAAFEVQGLEPGFEFEVGLDAEGNTCLRALTDGVLATSLPGTVAITPVTVGGITSLHYTITTPTPCQTIRPLSFGASGARSSYEFVGGIVHGIGCPDVLTTTEGVIEVGVLAGGTHRFSIVSGGQVIDTVTFDLPPTTLAVEGRLPDGRVRLAVAVPPGTVYVIETSPELQTWEPIFRGTGSATYIDTESPGFPERHYRLRIDLP